MKYTTLPVRTIKRLPSNNGVSYDQGMKDIFVLFA